MSELNPSVIVAKLPEQIENIQAAHFAKLSQSVDFVNDMAKQTGAKQAMDDAAAWQKAVETVQDFMRKFCGQEGDTLADSGSLWSFYEAAKKMQKATGGV